MSILRAAKLSCRNKGCESQWEQTPRGVIRLFIEYGGSELTEKRHAGTKRCLGNGNQNRSRHIALFE